MKKITIITFTFLSLGAHAEPRDIPSAEPFSVRCIGVKPICMPGQHPVCICESDYSYNCSWVCAGR